MSFKDKINSDLKEAMKAKESFKRDTLRLIMSAIKQIEVDERKVLSDEDVLNVLKKAIKQREDALGQYRSANREDLAKKEEDEIEIIKAYLPKQLSDDELKVEIQSLISSLNATTLKDLGALMKEATSKLGSVADGKRISQIAKELLG